MKILLIGGTGNISADVAELLHRQGHEVLVLTRGLSPVPRQYSSIVADRADRGALEKALKGQELEVVINFLGYQLSELEIDYSVFNGRLRQYIFISTAMVYEKPVRRLPITENTPLGNPFSEYAQNKQKCEEWLMDRFRSDCFPVTIVRPSHTYSRGWIPNPISSAGYNFAARLEGGRPVYLHNNGENPWTLTATSDFAAGLAGLVGKDRALGEAFHITSDEAFPWWRIYEEIVDAVGVKNPVIHRIPLDFICEKFPDLKCWLRGDKAEPAIFDNSKLKKLVPDFVCRKSFPAGIRESVEWMREHRDQVKDNPKVDSCCDKVVAAWLAR